MSSADGKEPEAALRPAAPGGAAATRGRSGHRFLAGVANSPVYGV
jgi:hypothetical protein